VPSRFFVDGDGIVVLGLSIVGKVDTDLDIGIIVIITWLHLHLGIADGGTLRDAGAGGNSLVARYVDADTHGVAGLGFVAEEVAVAIEGGTTIGGRSIHIELDVGVVDDTKVVVVEEETAVGKPYIGGAIDLVLGGYNHHGVNLVDVELDHLLAAGGGQEKEKGRDDIMELFHCMSYLWG